VFRALDHLVGERASPTFSVMHIYEIRPRKDKRGVDLISDALPFGRLWYVAARKDSRKKSEIF
jgi:hypothetical protein